MSYHVLLRAKGLIFTGLIVLGVAYYVQTYSLMLEDFDGKSTLPFSESGQYLNMAGSRAGVFTTNPDFLARYYKGPIYKLSDNWGFKEILQEAEGKGVKYLLIESTCVTSKELIDLFYHSVNPLWRRIPEEFQLRISKKWVYGLYLIGSEEEPVLFNAAIFSHLEWKTYVVWETMLASMGATTSKFDDTTSLSSIDLSEFDVVVFDDFKRPLEDAERSHLEQSIEKGLTIIVSGLSPYYLAGGNTDLTSISPWFGASLFDEAPKESRWKVRFTEDVKEITKDLDLNQEYEFYTDSDWSTPTGCIVESESIVYAYRVNDKVAAIFLHKFGKGTIIFNGPRFGLVSQDAGTLAAVLRLSIISTLQESSQ